jgi:hypothetical protein
MPIQLSHVQAYQIKAFQYQDSCKFVTTEHHRKEMKSKNCVRLQLSKALLLLLLLSHEGKRNSTEASANSPETSRISSRNKIHPKTRPAAAKKKN